MTDFTPASDTRISRTAIPTALMIDELILGIEPTLRRLLGEQIEILMALDSGSARIHADQGSIEKLLVNLSVNAQDAMPHGGKLFIETSRLRIEDSLASQALAAPLGHYISLHVTHEGSGMPPGARPDLSIVDGIVSKSGGFITVHSTPGIGTAFHLLFPVMAGAGSEVEQSEEESQWGTETVLVVEDESGVRNCLREVLEMHGYHVLDARTGTEALDIVRLCDGPIHVLITDFSLPGMRGDDLISRFVAIRPEAKVLRISGYPERSGSERHGRYGYLQKPFTDDLLLNKLRNILMEPRL